MRSLTAHSILLSLTFVFSISVITYITLAQVHTAQSNNSHTSITQLSEYVKNPNITLILPDKKYVTSLNDLGITLDPANLSLTATLAEVVIPSQDQHSPHITYNPQTGMLESASMPQDYVIQTAKLVDDLTGQIPQENITISPTYVLRDRFGENLALYNTRLANVFTEPLTIALKDGATFANIVLDLPTLRALIAPPSTDLNQPLEINKSQLLAAITPTLTPKEKQYFNPDAMYDNTREALNARFMDHPVPAVLGVDDGPTSDGSLSDRYLEVDLSQQKMYFFINHTLYKEYKISTGADYPTPVGEFHILNKAPNAFSTIYNVWMPYWMGFKYANDVGAYLGIHEIAYAVDEKGKHFYKHGYYIGEMFTGGCVAMEPKDAPEVYNLANVGMLVRIVK